MSNLNTSVFGNQNSNSIFDSFINQHSKPPIQDLIFNKENILKRSNHHQQSRNSILSNNESTISQATSKNNRSNSTSVLVIKALQNKISDLMAQIQKTQNEHADKIKDKDEMITHLQNIYQQMQKQYSNIEHEHRELIPILNQYQEDIMLMRQHKEQQLKEMKLNYDESLQVQLKKIQVEKNQIEEKLNQLIERYDQLEGTFNETNQDFKKEKQQSQRTKQDYLQKLDQNDQQFEEQIEHYQKSNAQLQGQLQKLILSESSWDKQKQQIQLTFSEERNALVDKHDNLTRENEELKDLYEKQIRSMEQDVQSLYHDSSNKNEKLKLENDSLKVNLQKIERENFETLNQKNQENFRLISMIDAVKEDVKNLSEQLKLEQHQNQNLESKLQYIQGQILFSKSEKQNLSDDSYRITSVTPKKMNQSISTYRDVSEIKETQNETKDKEYQELLQVIIVTEKRAFQLNQEYQQLFATFSGGNVLKQNLIVGNSQQLKTQMNQLMEKIKQSNSQLYELKTKEFAMLSYQ